MYLHVINIDIDHIDRPSLVFEIPFHPQGGDLRPVRLLLVAATVCNRYHDIRGVAGKICGRR